MIIYDTNPLKRCHLCKGREVLTFEDKKLIDTSLVQIGEKFFCKDRIECHRNIEAEATTDNFVMDSDGSFKGLSVIKDDEDVFFMDTEGDE